jgi:hypothetical protein
MRESVVVAGIAVPVGPVGGPVMPFGVGLLPVGGVEGMSSVCNEGTTTVTKDS